MRPWGVVVGWWSVCMYVCRLCNNHNTNIILDIHCCTTLLTLEPTLEVEVTLRYESLVVLSISLVAVVSPSSCSVASLLSSCIRTVLYCVLTWFASQVKSSYITTDGQSASLSWCQAPLSDPATNFSSFLGLFLDSYWFNNLGRLIWREVTSVVLCGTHFIDSIFKTPPPEGLCYCIYFPQEQGSPVIP
jgi:hypothetical protein